jgi:hypothetical protein
VADDLEVVACRVADEHGVVAGVVLGPPAGLVQDLGAEPGGKRPGVVDLFPAAVRAMWACRPPASVAEEK